MRQLALAIALSTFVVLIAGHIDVAANDLAGEIKEMNWIGFQQFQEVSRVFVRTTEQDKYHVDTSNPNNPAWIILSEEELEGMGEVMDAHGAIAIEDLAYFGMDLRQDYTRPGEPPYQPTVLHHTRRGICIISHPKS